MPFQERGADELLFGMLRDGRLELSSSPEMLSRTNTLIFVIGTPIDEFLNPKLTSAKPLAKLALHGHL